MAWAIRVVVAVLGIAAVGSESASADCLRVFAAWPTRDERWVPANTLIWIEVNYPGDQVLLRLTDHAGREVPTTRTLLETSGRAFYVLRPAPWLVVGARYHASVATKRNNVREYALMTGLSVDLAVDEEAAWRYVLDQGTTLKPPEWHEVTTFTVATGPDYSPPPVPQAHVRGYHVDRGIPGSCPPSTFVSALFDLSTSSQLVVFDTNGGRELDAGAVSGSTTAIERPRPYMAFGVGGCPPHSWPSAAPGVTADVVVGGFDLAGNFSGFSPSVRVEVPLEQPPTQASCGILPPAGPWWR